MFFCVCVVVVVSLTKMQLLGKEKYLPVSTEFSPKLRAKSGAKYRATFFEGNIILKVSHQHAK